MGVTTDRSVRLDERERLLDSAIARFVPYVGLVIGTVLTPFVVPTTAGFWLVTGAVVVAAAVWSYVFATRRAPRPRGDGGAGCGAGEVLAADRRLGAVYVVGLLVFMAVLVVRSPLYGFMAVGAYAHSFTFLRGHWRWVGLFAGATCAAYTQMGGGFADVTPGFFAGWATLALLNSLMGGVFTYFGAFTGEQSERRRLVIAELNEANRRLEESLEENAVLQARLVAQAREAGVLDERARMAREIHDTLAQGLTGIVTQLEAADSPDPTLQRRHVDTARALARESLTEARRSVDALAPGRLAGARLPDAVTDLAKDWGETTGVDVRVETTGEPLALLPEIEVTLFRVAQESLANAAKHAAAERVWVTLSYMGDVVVLDVRDDGAGFDPEQRAARDGGSGFGLLAMEQRVARVAGEFTVESAPGDGTVVSASVPALPAERGDA